MAKKTNQQKFEEKLKVGNNYDMFCNFIEQQSKLLSDRNLLFWRLWFCNYIYKKYESLLREELVNIKQIISEDQLICLNEIREYGWEIFDNEKTFKKKRLKEYHQQLKEINTTDLDVHELAGCALSELIKGFEIVLISLIKGKRGDEGSIYQTTINILKVELQKEGKEFLENLNRVDVLLETWGQIDLLDVLLSKKWNDKIISGWRNIYREKYIDYK